MAQVIISYDEYQEYLELKKSKIKNVGMLRCEKKSFIGHMQGDINPILHVKVNSDDVLKLLKEIGAVPKETVKLFYD